MENHLCKLIENNYCGCYTDICKKGLSEKLSLAMKQKVYSNDDIITMISICKGGPISEKTITIIYKVLLFISLKGIRYECFDSLVELLMVLYIKSDSETQKCFMDDIENYFKEVSDINSRWSEMCENFKFDFYFLNIICKRDYMIKDAKDGRGFQSEPASFKEFSQTKGLEISSEIKKSINNGKGDEDQRVVNIDSIEKFIKYSSLLGKLMQKILFLNQDNIESKNKTKLLLQRLIFIANLCSSNLFYYPISAISSFYLEEKSKIIQIYSLKEPRELYKAEKEFGKGSLLTWHKGFWNNLLMYDDYGYVIKKTIEVIHRIQKESEDKNAVIKSILILQKTYSILTENKEQSFKIFVDLIEKLFGSFSKLQNSEK